MLLNKLKQFTRLPISEKTLFVEAYIRLGLMRAAVLTVSFKRLTKSLDHSTEKDICIDVTDTQMKMALSISKLIRQAANYTPWESNCLAQVLTIQRMLKNRGIPGVFFLGVSKSDTDQKKLAAHAWSQCRGIVLTGEHGHEQFTVLSAFVWGSQ